LFWQNVKVPRPYRQSQRAQSHDETRRRILEAAIDTLVNKRDFQVRDIAAAAPVSLQTLYSHFGSKANLLMNVVGAISVREGLVEGIAGVWNLDDGVAQLEEMARVTMAFWHRAWPFVGYTLTAHRTDPEFAEMRRQTDASRYADLVQICQRVANDGRLRDHMTPKAAAALVFAISAPTVYEDLVVSRRLPVRVATREVQRLVVAAVTKEAGRSGAAAPAGPCRP
jgi:AcrR family transcriptional regulator